MFKTDFARTLAAMACTVVMSATCVLGAVGPAQAGAGAKVGGVAAVAHAARLIA